MALQTLDQIADYMNDFLLGHAPSGMMACTNKYGCLNAIQRLCDIGHAQFDLRPIIPPPVMMAAQFVPGLLGGATQDMTINFGDLTDTPKVTVLGGTTILSEATASILDYTDSWAKVRLLRSGVSILSQPAAVVVSKRKSST